VLETFVFAHIRKTINFVGHPLRRRALLAVFQEKGQNEHLYPFKAAKIS
jgi:hypothetical protein